MKNVLNLITDNRNLRVKTSLYEATLIEVYKNIVLGNTDLALALIKHSMKEVEHGKENN